VESKEYWICATGQKLMFHRERGRVFSFDHNMLKKAAIDQKTKRVAQG
jgi:hypothetical protein